MSTARLLFILGISLFSGVVAHADISLMQTEFINSDFPANNNRDLTMVDAKVQSTLPEDPGQMHLLYNVEGVYSPNVSVMDYLNVESLAWVQKGFTVGRKKMNWSQLDENWNLGMYQPMFRWNPVEPSSQGLTGLFVDLEQDNWRLTLFGSELYIPDQGPGYQIKSGTFVQVDPWFNPPPPQILFENQLETINYHVDTPQINDILFNASMGAVFQLGDLTEGWSFHSSFLHAPANQLDLGLTGVLTPNASADVQITPKVFYHDVSSAQVAYSANTKYPLRLSMDVMHELTNSPEFSAGETYVTYSPSTAVSPTISMQGLGWQGALSYLKVYGGLTQLSGALIESSTAARMFPRYPFTEASQAKLGWQQRIGPGQKLRENMIYLRGARNAFEQVIGKIEYDYRDQYQVSLSTDLLRANQDNSSLIGVYQNNSAATLGVSYVF